MTWNTDQQETTQPETQQTKLIVTCDGTNYDCSSLEGFALSEKVKAIAREKGFGKFDVFDDDNTNLSPERIQSGEFEGDLRVVRFNAAA